MSQNDAVNHPQHYGGADSLTEAIKVIEAWRLGFCLGNTVKHICLATGKSGYKAVQDLEQALWYLHRDLDNKGVTQPAGPIILPADVSFIYKPHMGAISADWDLSENLHICLCAIYGSRLVSDGRYRLLTAGMLLKKEIERLKEEACDVAA